MSESKVKIAAIAWSDERDKYGRLTIADLEDAWNAAIQWFLAEAEKLAIIKGGELDSAEEEVVLLSDLQELAGIKDE